MKPLCRDECRGLCPVCGTNLNRATCDCRRDWEDPRARGAREHLESRTAESRCEQETRCRIQNDDTPRRARPSAGRRRAEAGRPQRVPALPRAEAAAPRLRQLRLLPRPPGAGGRRRRRSDLGLDPSASSTLIPRMIWIAVDAMGGDDAPRHIVDGALAAARHFDLGVALVGAGRRARRRAARGMPTSTRAGVRIVDADDVVDDGGVAGGGAAPQAGRVDPGRGRAGGARARRRRCSAPATPARR